MRRLLAFIAIAVGLGSAIAYAQIINPSGGGGGTPGGSNTQLQFNTNTTFGGISGVTSDSANVGFATSSQLLLYGFTVGDCVKIGANNALADFGSGCGGTGSPGGTNGQVQFNTNGNFGGISGATSNASSISFTTNSLVINGQAISHVSGATGTLASVTGTLVSGNCLQSDSSHNLIDSGSATCGGIASSSTNIAAGSNIATSGSTANVTVAVVGSPVFTNVTANTNLTATAIQVSGPIGLGGGPAGGIFLSSSNASATAFTLTLPSANDQLIGRQTTDSLNNKTFDTALNILRINGQSVTATTGNVAQIVTASGTLSSGHCTQWDPSRNLIDSGAPCATQTSTPSIAAGSNITTSGTSSNVTINVVATPSFTTVIASGNVTAGTAQFTGLLTGTNAVFQTMTVNNLTPTGPNCLQETAGVLQATNVACATQTSTPSIAAGSNITTSGTAANTTINVVATPSFTTVIATSNLTASTVLGVVGWLTAPGFNAQTATLAGALIGTSGNFSSNLTATTVLGVVGWLTAPGVNAQTETIASALNGSTGNFTSNLTGQIGAFPGFLTASGVSFNSLTVVNSLTSTTGNFTSILSASIYTGTATGAGTLSFITPGIAQFATGGTAATNNGWMNWGGESRLAADKGLNISNAGLTPTGLSVNVQGGRNYSIDADLYVTLAVAATSGIAVSLSGTYGSTDTHYFGYVIDGGANTGANGTFESVRGATLATAKNTIVGNVSLSGTTGYVSVKGTVSVSAPGTLLIAAATVNTQTAANGVTLTRGSRILVQDMP